MAAQAAQSQRDQAAHTTVIIKRVKKGRDAPHHGGAWKVAYADFVTAMMAFFLLLWLLNATTEEQKQAISNYFAPESASYTQSGAGGVLGGQTLSEEGALANSTSPPGMDVPVITAPNEDPDVEPGQRPGETPGGSRDTREDAGDTGRESDDWMPRTDAGPGANLGLSEEPNLRADEIGGDAMDPRLEAARQVEEQAFREASASLREAIDSSPDLQRFAANLVVQQTDAGLEIQVIDQEKVSMFPRGSAVMYEHMQSILKQVTAVVQKLPDHRIAITGHTDATQYPDPNGYSNWELSTDRAHATRRSMLEYNLDAERVVQVVGKADRSLLIEDNPEDARNRRISIVLIRNAPAPTSGDG